MSCQSVNSAPSTPEIIRDHPRSSEIQGERRHTSIPLELSISSCTNRWPHYRLRCCCASGAAWWDVLGLQLSDRFLVFGMFWMFWEAQSDTRDDLLDLQKAKLLNIVQLISDVSVLPLPHVLDSMMLHESP